MKVMQTESKAEILNRLFKENGLLKEDYHEHKHYKIITRSGIEKIQYQNNVTVTFDAVTMTPEFCVVKAHAEKLVYDQEKDEIIVVETFGSAGHNANGEPDKGKQYQYLYYPEMAEKRALSRAVLKICNFYELGVFGEDESPEFKRLEITQNKPAETAKPAEPVTTPNPAQNSSNSVKFASPKQKEEIIRLLNNPVITRQEKTKMLININKLDEERAIQAISKLKKVIEEREEQTDAAD